MFDTFVSIAESLKQTEIKWLLISAALLSAILL